jgi:hypothetical protein
MPWRRFFGITSLLLVITILVIFVSQALEVRQRTDPDEFRIFARNHGLDIEEVPDWIIGRYRRFEHFLPDDWLQTGIAALGWSFFTWIGFSTLQPARKERQGRSDPKKASMEDKNKP